MVLVAVATLALGVPILICLGIIPLIYVFMEGMPIAVLAQRMVLAVNSFPHLAIFLFMLAANLMNGSGITRRLVNFANALVGHLTGGLGHVNVVTSMIFAGISGSALADTAGIGAIQIKGMVDAGFSPDFSAAITASSSTIGPIIPPSIQMVIYALLASCSVGALFVAGIIPGILMGVFLMVYVYIVSKKRNYPKGKWVGWKNLLKSFIEALLPMCMPLIIIGGVTTGFFTATESAAIAVLYAVILGIAYRDLKLKDIPRIIIDTVASTGTILGVLATASALTWMLTVLHVPTILANTMLSLTSNKYVMLLIFNVFLLILGCIMEPTAAQSLATPILLAIALPMGINVIHLGLIIVLNLMIGLLTPPVGLCLYVVQEVTQISFQRIVKAVIPTLIPLVILLLLVTYFEPLVTWLPTLLGLM